MYDKLRAEADGDGGLHGHPAAFWKSDYLIRGHTHVLLVEWRPDEQLRVWKPHVGGPALRPVGAFEDNYTKIKLKEARTTWSELFDEAVSPETTLAPRLSLHYLLAGEFFRLWASVDEIVHRVTDKHAQLCRARLKESGEGLVGLEIPGDAVDSVRRSMALKPPPSIAAAVLEQPPPSLHIETPEAPEPPCAVDDKTVSKYEKGIEKMLKKHAERHAAQSKDADDDDDFI
jgi:hypothetical protein